MALSWGKFGGPLASHMSAQPNSKLLRPETSPQTRTSQKGSVQRNFDAVDMPVSRLYLQKICVESANTMSSKCIWLGWDLQIRIAQNDSPRRGQGVDWRHKINTPHSKISEGRLTPLLSAELQVACTVDGSSTMY